MSQQSVCFHTEKNLCEAEEILAKEKIEIIVRSSTMYLNFSQLTPEEQNGWIKSVDEDLEDAVDEVTRYYNKLERFYKKTKSFPLQIREMMNELRKSENLPITDRHKHLIQKLMDFSRETQHLSYYSRYRLRDIRLDDRIRCSCIIARKGNDIVRYLEFQKDPIVTITGPKAANLKSSLEKKF